MPEGPECLQFANYLSNWKGKKCVGHEVISGRYEREEIVKSDFKYPLIIREVNCKGKFIFAKGDSHSIFMTMGMTGWLGKKIEKHSRVIFYFEDAEDLVYSDTRSFGTLSIRSNEELVKKLEELGPDLLADSLDIAGILSRLKRNDANSNICVALMNQKNCAGIGNYIKSEALYMSKISPYATVDQISEEKLQDLYLSARDVAIASFYSGGASIRDYKIPGTNETSSAILEFMVYAKSITPRGEKVLKIKTEDGRSTYTTGDLI